MGKKKRLGKRRRREEKHEMGEPKKRPHSHIPVHSASPKESQVPLGRAFKRLSQSLIGHAFLTCSELVNLTGFNKFQSVYVMIFEPSFLMLHQSLNSAWFVAV